MKGWVDSHAHVFSEEFNEDREAVIQRAKAEGFVKIMIVCVTLKEAEAAIERAKTDSMLDVAVGFHPCDIAELNEEDWHKLEELVHNPSVAAVGEIGLDLYWNPDNLEQQKAAFVRQINLANAAGKPILVHSRDAIQETYQLMKANPTQHGGIIHCFSSSLEMAREFIKLGYKIGLGGPVTFKNAKTPKEVAANIPLEALLLETDCPYLTPHPYRGKRNEPMYAAITGKLIAELRGITEETLQEAMLKTYLELFHGEN